MKSRIKELDGLRGLAAFSVMLFHYTNNHNTYAGEVPFFEYGHYGVEMFFVISGFVISLTLYNKSDITEFAKARFFRLFPIYWVCVIITFSIVEFIGLTDMKRSFIDFLLNFTMIQRFIGVEYVDGSYWSLQYELFFYAIIAILHFKLRLNHMVILKVFASLSFLSLIINILGAHQMMQVEGGIFEILYFRLYGVLILEFIHLFLIGITLYNFITDQISLKTMIIFIALSLLTSLSFSIQDFIALGVILVIFYTVLKMKWSFWRSNLMTWLGAISYVLYLIHMNIGRSLINLIRAYDINTLWSITIVMSIILCLASLIHYQIEKPLFRKLINWRK